jgi:hypothetical protein
MASSVLATVVVTHLNVKATWFPDADALTQNSFNLSNSQVCASSNASVSWLKSFH